VSLGDYLASIGMTLSDFNVVIGLPQAAADWTLVENYVSAGGNLILYSSSSSSPNLTGTTVMPFTHPIYEPYTQAALIAGGHDGNDYINSYGSGHVITLNSIRYGDGFAVGGTAASDGGADGLASGLGFLTLNAISWAGGQPTGAIYLPEYVERTSWAAPLNSNGEGDWSGIGIHAIGYPLQTIILSNYNTTKTAVSFDINPTSFDGISSTTTFLDANTGDTSKAAFDVSIPASDWMVFIPTGGTLITPTTLTLTVT
jgi:hypothetical protein